mmetsp:Transcript_15321/g.27789  ORF Transcript_15321/g.27789 Transcript_15321/m.27789 type:complete len:261 (-) Transcript_15321:267-1049(-)
MGGSGMCSIGNSQFKGDITRQFAALRPHHPPKCLSELGRCQVGRQITIQIFHHTCLGRYRLTSWYHAITVGTLRCDAIHHCIMKRHAIFEKLHKGVVVFFLRQLHHVMENDGTIVWNIIGVDDTYFPIWIFASYTHLHDMSQQGCQIYHGLIGCTRQTSFRDAHSNHRYRFHFGNQVKGSCRSFGASQSASSIAWHMFCGHDAISTNGIHLIFKRASLGTILQKGTTSGLKNSGTETCPHQCRHQDGTQKSTRSKTQTIH